MQRALIEDFFEIPTDTHVLFNIIFKFLNFYSEISESFFSSSFSSIETSL